MGVGMLYALLACGAEVDEIDDDDEEEDEGEYGESRPSASRPAVQVCCEGSHGTCGGDGAE